MALAEIKAVGCESVDMFHLAQWWALLGMLNNPQISCKWQEPLRTYVVCPKSKCTDFLFKCLLDSPEITSYLLQSMTLGKLHSSSVFSTDHSSTGSHFP